MTQLEKVANSLSKQKKNVLTSKDKRMESWKKLVENQNQTKLFEK
jgi:hypothetical protein